MSNEDHIRQDSTSPVTSSPGADAPRPTRDEQSAAAGREEWRPIRETKKQRAWVPGQQKKPRSVRIMFASTVLSFEAIVLFFFGLTVFNLNRDAEWAPWILGVSWALAVVAVLTCALLRHPVGYWIGWVIQFALLAGGFIEPSAYLVGIGFFAAWWYAVYKGRILDLETKQRQAAEEQWRRDHPEPQA